MELNSEHLSILRQAAERGSGVLPFAAQDTNLDDLVVLADELEEHGYLETVGCNSSDLAAGIDVLIIGISPKGRAAMV